MNAQRWLQFKEAAAAQARAQVDAEVKVLRDALAETKAEREFFRAFALSRVQEFALWHAEQNLPDGPAKDEIRKAVASAIADRAAA